jgi:hypothetical protein
MFLSYSFLKLLQLSLPIANNSGFVLAEESDGSGPDSCGGNMKSIKVVLEKFCFTLQ